MRIATLLPIDSNEKKKLIKNMTLPDRSALCVARQIIEPPIFAVTLPICSELVHIIQTKLLTFNNFK